MWGKRQRERERERQTSTESEGGRERGGPSQRVTERQKKASEGNGERKKVDAAMWVVLYIRVLRQLLKGLGFIRLKD